MNEDYANVCSLKFLVTIFFLFATLVYKPLDVIAEENHILEIYSSEDMEAALKSNSYDNAILKLMTDLEGNYVYEKQDHSIIIDLNDHSITGLGEENVSVIWVKSGMLTLVDNAEKKTRHYYKLNDKVAVISAEKDDLFYFDGGFITGGQGEANGVAIGKAGRFYMKGGTVIGNYGGGVGGSSVEMSGGNIIGNYSFQGAGIEANSIIISGSARIVDNIAAYGAGVEGNLIMNGGSICRNRSLSNGGGIYAGQSSCDITINAGVISDNIGEGIYFSGRKLIMTGGIIRNNTSERWGGGIHVGGRYSTFEMTGGLIEGNKADSLSGGGVFVSTYADVAMTMKGGSITNNIGGGIYFHNNSTIRIEGGQITNNVDGGIIQRGQMKICGAPNISGNYKIINNVKVNCNVLLYKDYYITVDGKLEDDALIGVSVDKPVSGTTVEILRGLSDKSKLKCFISDEPGYTIVERGTGAVLNIKSYTDKDQIDTSNQIDIPKVKISSAQNDKKKQVTVKWEQIKYISGYQIQYAYNKKFTKSVKQKKVKASAISTKIKKLKKKKTYYIRIRAFRRLNGSDNEYGEWSKVKKIKVKK